MRVLASTALALALVTPTYAGSWLAGPSAYEQAVAAMAAAEWDRAESLIEAARPEEGRVEWVKRLLRERRQGDEQSGYPRFQETGDASHLDVRRSVFHAYAYHNVFLFLRTESQPDELVHDALDRADAAYQAWIRQTPERLDPSLRWAYAGLLHDADRAMEAAEFLDSTGDGAAVPAGQEGPLPGEAERFTLGFQMLVAYFHAARGDAEGALAYLLAARRRDPAYVNDWVRRSDDFWTLRNHPEFVRMFSQPSER
jgi:hypothetical protein